MNNLSFRRSNQVDIDLDDLANWDDLPHSGSATPLSSGESEPNDMEVQDSGSVRYDTPVTLRSDNMSPSPLLLPDNASAPPPPNPALDNESLNNTPRQTDYMSVDAGAGPSNTASYAFTFSKPNFTPKLLSPIELKTRK